MSVVDRLWPLSRRLAATVRRNEHQGRPWHVGRAVLATLGMLLFLPPATVAAGPTAPRQNGARDGVWFWTLPNTPNGMHPNQSWSGGGSDSNGTIYVAGMDHVANSALYRLPAGNRTAPGATLYYAGDARAASTAIGNWKAGDIAEKFHTRPTFHANRVYVANLNHSPLDDGYLRKSGMRWYGFDVAAGTLRDLSKGEPGGYALQRGGVVGITVDAPRGKIFGLVNPTGELVRFDIATSRTTRLGRPAYQRTYVYPGRALWTGASGRVYFSAGNIKPTYGGPYDPAIFDHIHYWDPVTGFGQLTTWKLNEIRAIDTVQCFGSPKVCFLSDNAGNIYKFTDGATPTWRYLGRITAGYPGFNWVFHVNAAKTRAYLLPGNGRLYEFDLTLNRTARSIDLAAIEPSLAAHHYYGHDAWDAYGRFYFVTMPVTSTPASLVRLVAIDPTRLFAAAAR